MYNVLIMSNNYVTKRQSLKLLGEILLDRANYSIMTRYIASEANLKLMMNFLRDRSRNIQFEAFHVFKVGYTGGSCVVLTVQVFVANPNKPPEIARILKRNKERLLIFLKDFHNDKEGECGGVRVCEWSEWSAGLGCCGRLDIGGVKSTKLWHYRRRDGRPHTQHRWRVFHH
jgi:hypothetical protein